MRPYLFLLSLFCIACTDQYTALSPRDPVYTEGEQDLSPFEERGEKYTRRGELTSDTSRFAPDPGESYEHYRERIFNTLLAQELEIESINDKIGMKKDSIDNLQAQLEPMRTQQGEMRLALARQEDGEAIAGGPEQSKSRPLFHRHEIQKGDTLQGISQEYYETYTGWIALYRFNHTRLPYGPNRIEKGQTLIIPDLEKLEATPPQLF